MITLFDIYIMAIGRNTPEDEFLYNENLIKSDVYDYFKNFAKNKFNLDLEEGYLEFLCDKFFEHRLFIKTNNNIEELKDNVNNLFNKLKHVVSDNLLNELKDVVLINDDRTIIDLYIRYINCLITIYN